MRVGYSASAVTVHRRHNFRYVSDLAWQVIFPLTDLYEVPPRDLGIAQRNREGSSEQELATPASLLL